MKIRNQTAHAGFSMVEVLVALVVLSVGMLGIAALYVTSLQSGGGAIYRMQAVNLAADLADRIRANRSISSPTTGYAGAAANNSCEGAGSKACSASEMAANDLYVWRDAIKAALPGAAALTNSGGTVTVTAVAGSSLFRYDITVAWSDPADGTLSYTTSLEI